jgi:hypothetical protein
VVEDVLLPLGNAGCHQKEDEEVEGSARKRCKKGKQLQKEEEEAEEDGGLGNLLASVIDVVTEHAMLYLGGRKYRARAFVVGSITNEEEEAAATAETETEASRDSNESDSSSSSSSDDSEVDEDGKLLSKTKVAVQDERSSIDCPRSISVAASQPPVPVSVPAAPQGHKKRELLEEEEEEVSKHQKAATATTATEERVGVNNTSSGGWEIVVRHPVAKKFESQDMLPSLPHRGFGESMVLSPAVAAAASAKIAPPWETLPWGLPLLDRANGRAVGRWGEAFVYQLLLQKFPPESGAEINWLNEHEETRAAYDLQITFPGIPVSKASNNSSSSSSSTSGHWGEPHRSSRKRETIFVEVKTTSSDHSNTFDLSLQEWEFATRAVSSSLVNYHIYRVFSAGNSNRVRVHVVEDVLASIEAKQVRLCLTV